MFLTSFPAGPLQANCYLLSMDGRRCVVVDPGVNSFDEVRAIVAERGLAVEAVLLAALTGVGVAAAPALAAVFLYRLVTFWAPIPVGGLSMRWLVGRDLL